jgi:hypothetical protein
VDKRGYTLSNPTPAAALREMSTGRPDKTGSPYTVDAGHFQIEMDPANFTCDHDTAAGANTFTRAWNVAPAMSSTFTPRKPAPAPLTFPARSRNGHGHTVTSKN